MVLVFKPKNLVPMVFLWYLLFSFDVLPGPPKVCFLEVFCYIKPTKKHSFGGLGMCFFLVVSFFSFVSYGFPVVF